MELIHEPIIKRSEIFEALRAGFFEAFEEKDLGPRVELFQQMAELRHRIAAGRNAQNIVDQPLDELLGNVFAGQISFGEFSGCQKLVEGNGLRGKWNGQLWTRGHAGATSRF